jgi:Uma2 family endonuclease
MVAIAGSAVTVRGARIPPRDPVCGGGTEEYVVAVVASAEPRPFTFEEVLRMVDAGVLGRDERVELLDGVLVRMSPEGLDHFGAGGALSHVLHAAYHGTEYRVRENSTLYLGERNFLEPDLIVFSGEPFTWPTPGGTVLIVEVANTSLAYDIADKARRYARWGLGEYWVVDLPDRALLIHTDPVAGTYRSVVRIGGDREVALPGDAGRLRVADVLPPV